MPGGWADSTRSARLPANWSQIRARILRRDQHRCQVLIDRIICGAYATDVDHVIPNDDDSDANLRAICAWHHRRKSSVEGNKARRRLSRKRAAEPHPGSTS